MTTKRTDTNVIAHRLDDNTLEKLRLISSLEDRSVASLVREYATTTTEHQARKLNILSELSDVTAVPLDFLAKHCTNLNDEDDYRRSLCGGIYALYNKSTAELYIGSSSSIASRIKGHRGNIETGSHANKSITNWTTDEVFVVELEHCSENLRVREQYFIDAVKAGGSWTTANIATAHSTKPSIKTQDLDIQPNKLNNKTIATKLHTDTLETLELLADFNRTSVANLVRLSVERYIEQERYRVHPLSLTVAVELEGILNVGCQTLIEDAYHLTDMAAFGNNGGVYLLVHSETREFYVGSTTELNDRITHHRFNIKTSKHRNSAINNWNVDDVVVVLLQRISGDKSAEHKAELLLLEQKYINTLKKQKEWKLLNLATAYNEDRPARQPRVAAPSNNSAGVTSAQETVAKPVTETPTVEEDTDSDYSTEELFFDNWVKPVLFELLESDVKQSRDLVRLMAEARQLSEQHYKWAVRQLKECGSSWVNRLAADDRFPMVLPEWGQ